MNEKVALLLNMEFSNEPAQAWLTHKSFATKLALKLTNYKLAPKWGTYKQHRTKKKTDD